MANKHYEHALKGLPCRVSTTAHLIYQIICYRYDDREFIEGKPNRGYLKSYPGMDLLMSATGRGRNACNTAMESLIKENLVARITIGKPGVRAEYRPIYTLEALGESVSNTRHVSKVYKPRGRVENVSSALAKSLDNEHIESLSQDTISTISNHKYDKSKTYDYVNYERWHVISQDLPQLLVKQWVHSKESEALLDQILNGTTLKAFRANLRRLNFDKAYDLTGLYMDYLRQCAGVNKPTEGIPTRDQLDADLKKLSEFDIVAELRKYNGAIDLDTVFKMPD
jgi:hypothetical protein